MKSSYSLLFIPMSIFRFVTWNRFYSLFYLIISCFYHKHWIWKKTRIYTSLLSRKHVSSHFVSFDDWIKNVTFVKTVWKTKSPLNHSFQLFIWKSRNYFARNEIFYTFSFLLLFHLFVSFSLLFNFLDSNLLENALDFFSKLRFIFLNVFNQILYINDWKAIIFS